MALAVDTSAYSSFYRGTGEKLVKYFSVTEDIYIPYIVIAELRAGYKLGNKEKENNYLLEKFLNQPNVNTLYPTDVTLHEYATVYLNLRKKGKPINVNDMWIAALCIENNLPLLTLDKDFKNIKELKLIG